MQDHQQHAHGTAIGRFVAADALPMYPQETLRSMSSLEKSSDHPFVAEGGIELQQLDHEADPFAALDDLMVVIEALCPTWPDRKTFSNADRFLLGGLRRIGRTGLRRGFELFKTSGLCLLSVAEGFWPGSLFLPEPRVHA